MVKNIFFVNKIILWLWATHPTRLNPPVFVFFVDPGIDLRTGLTVYVTYAHPGYLTSKHYCRKKLTFAAKKIQYPCEVMVNF